MTGEERESYEAALEQLQRQRAALDAAIDAIRRHLEVEPAAAAAVRCPTCRGIGMKETGEYCSCQLGRDLRRVEERSKQKNEEVQA